MTDNKSSVERCYLYLHLWWFYWNVIVIVIVIVIEMVQHSLERSTGSSELSWPVLLTGERGTEDVFQLVFVLVFVFVSAPSHLRWNEGVLAPPAPRWERVAPGWSAVVHCVALCCTVVQWCSGSLWCTQLKCNAVAPRVRLHSVQCQSVAPAPPRAQAHARWTYGRSVVRGECGGDPSQHQKLSVRSGEPDATQI